MRVLLVGNYIEDRQESMQLFAGALENGLRNRGDEVHLLRPPVLLGRLRRGSDGAGKWLGYFDKFVVFPPLLRRRAAVVDVVHICDHSNAMYVGTIHAKPHVVTCNDLLAVRSALGEFPKNRTKATGKLLQSWIRRGLERAQYIASISHATQSDLLRLTERAPERGEVIYMGMNQALSPMGQNKRDRVLDSLFQRSGLARPSQYLFHVGGDQWYKNRSGVIALFHEISKGDALSLGLVFAGARESTRQREQICELGMTERVSFVGPISTEELRALYSGAEAILFPSLAEGFGWPIIEAQACGCRVVTSDRAPMNEIGGACCLYVNPEEVSASASRVREMLAETPTQRAERIAQGFENSLRYGAQEMIDRYSAVYAKVISESRRKEKSDP